MTETKHQVNQKSIHNNQEIKKIEDKSNHYTATVELNGKKKEFYHRITDKNNATGRKLTGVNRDTKSHKQIPSRE